MWAFYRYLLEVIDLSRFFRGETKHVSHLLRSLLNIGHMWLLWLLNLQREFYVFIITRFDGSRL